jgi:TetR/AcrR family transcriptional regulator
MAEPERRQGRTRDAERTRRVILDAAEAVFAEHGFDGARFDAIAQAAGYNRSLIGQYFGDKLGLYTALFERINRDITEVGMRILAPLLEDETVISDAQRLRALLVAIIGMLFDYTLEHPRLLRLVHWEQAEGWQTFTKFSSHFEAEDTEQWRELFYKAYRAGLLKSDFEPMIQLTLIEQLCWAYCAALPLYQTVLPGEDVSSPAALARAREFIIAFVVRGLMGDPNARE